MESEPYECVGLIHPDSTTTRLINQARSVTRFLVNPVQLRDHLIDRDQRGQDPTVWGIYHSHVMPGTSILPSQPDITFMRQIETYWPGVRHIILTEDDLAVWVLKQDYPERIL